MICTCDGLGQEIIDYNEEVVLDYFSEEKRYIKLVEMNLKCAECGNIKYHYHYEDANI